MNEPIKLDRGETVAISDLAGSVSLHLSQGFLQMSKRLSPAQAEAIGGQLIQAAKSARASLLPSKVPGVRCHNSDSCKAGQAPCPTPTACGIKAPA